VIPSFDPNGIEAENCENYKCISVGDRLEGKSEGLRVRS